MKPKTLVNIAVNSSLLEIRTWPKPGNVHKTQNFSQSTYQDFLTVAYQGTSSWTKMYCILENSSIPLGKLYVSFLKFAVKKMMAIQTGGNVLLGHFLLLIPLFISAFQCIKLKNPSRSLYWNTTQQIFKESTPYDTIALYEAIREAHPGGMGTKTRYDLYNPSVHIELLQDKINLLHIFEYSKEDDGISDILASNYEFVRTQIVPTINQYLEDYPNLSTYFPKKFYKEILQKDLTEISVELNELILRVYLYILSHKPDTLIIRKTSEKLALGVTHQARQVLDGFYKENRKEWIKSVFSFDNHLQKAGGKLNPGTTADLLACSLFVYLIENHLFKRN